MVTTEKEYAAHAIIEAIRERLLKKRAALEAQLASLSIHLAEIQASAEEAPKPVTATVRTQHNEYDDWGYQRSYRYPAKKLKVTASHFDIIYLGALAKQGSPLSTELTAPSATSTRDYCSIWLSHIELDGIDFAKDINETQTQNLFKAAEPRAMEITDKLREKIENNNPYQDIPIKINHAELIDALLRIEILKYCRDNDPSFFVEESAEK